MRKGGREVRVTRSGPLCDGDKKGRNTTRHIFRRGAIVGDFPSSYSITGQKEESTNTLISRGRERKPTQKEKGFWSPLY